MNPAKLSAAQASSTRKLQKGRAPTKNPHCHELPALKARSERSLSNHLFRSSISHEYREADNSRANFFATTDDLSTRDQRLRDTGGKRGIRYESLRADIDRVSRVIGIGGYVSSGSRDKRKKADTRRLVRRART